MTGSTTHPCTLHSSRCATFKRTGGKKLEVEQVSRLSLITLQDVSTHALFPLCATHLQIDSLEWWRLAQLQHEAPAKGATALT